MTDEQILVNGRIWRYTHRQIKGNPFLYSNKYLGGSVYINGRTFNYLKIRYDIFNDELIMPLDTIVLQLNKEQIDSFSFFWENRKIDFIKTAENNQWPFSGYVQNVYSGKSKFFVKYQKKIDKPGVLDVPDNFYQVRQMYYIRNGRSYPVKTRSDILRLMENEEDRIRDFIRNNKLHIRMKQPESLTPLLRYYDQITQGKE